MTGKQPPAYFFLTGQIDNDLLNRFIDFYNNNRGSLITVIIKTIGGDLKNSELIIEMINQNKNNTLHIISAFSAGMLIAVKCKCKKQLSKYSMGMWHYGKWDIEIGDKGKPYYKQDACITKEFPRHKKNADLFAKEIMTTKEFKKFKKDDDVYFGFKRMKQIFPDAKIINQ